MFFKVRVEYKRVFFSNSYIINYFCNITLPCLYIYIYKKNDIILFIIVAWLRYLLFLGMKTFD